MDMPRDDRAALFDGGGGRLHIARRLRRYSSGEILMEIMQIRWFDRTGGRYLPWGLAFSATRFPSAAIAREAVERFFMACGADADICGEGFLAKPLYWDIQEDERWSYVESGGIVADVYADETEVSATFYGFAHSRDRERAIAALRSVCREMDGDETVGAAYCG